LYIDNYYLRVSFWIVFREFPAVVRERDCIEHLVETVVDAGREPVRAVVDLPGAGKLRRRGRSDETEWSLNVGHQSLAQSLTRLQFHRSSHKTHTAAATALIVSLFSVNVTLA